MAIDQVPPVISDLRRPRKCRDASGIHGTHQIAERAVARGIDQTDGARRHGADLGQLLQVEVRVPFPSPHFETRLVAGRICPGDECRAVAFVDGADARRRGRYRRSVAGRLP